MSVPLRVGLLLCAAGLAGCFSMSAGGNIEKAADEQVSAFHKHLNRGDIDGLIAMAHPDLLKASSEEELRTIFTLVHDKLGAVMKSETVRSHYSSMTSGASAVVVKETTFANGKGTETFTFRMEGDKALLLGYNINSMDLLTK
jgi:hypothetical protein